MKRFVSRIPEYGKSSEDTKTLKAALNEKINAKLDTTNDYFGENTETAVKKLQTKAGLIDDGKVGPLTLKALDIEVVREEVGLPHAANPAYEEAKKYVGQKETDKKLQDKLVPYWKRVGLKGYKTLVGTAFAWCALFVFATNTDVGQKVIASASAKSIGQSGVTINFKQNGIPEGAGMWIDSGGDCKDAKNNHVTYAAGDCTAAHVNTKGSAVPGLGGNQGNMVKRSMYRSATICRVFWPEEIPLPGAITKNKNCSGTVTDESTR
jgi:hypothetical protein